ncbi:MAG: Ni/Fe-hydrogenase cytochrome b subunit [Gammaproteobacteria bacterium]|nr:MAG: Ni/Fe-hydrogenase cytochrome b subunit [Gammaproteobacteria bacterium]
MSEYRILKRPLLTPVTLFFGVLAVIGLILLAKRFIFGLGSVTNLNDGYPWGIWVVYDIMIGTAFACGGYALALTVYIFNRGQYHPLVRPALLASLFGYGLGGLSAVIDMGRYWNAWQIINPWQQNFNAVMLEVALCITAYVTILIIEFLPAVLERFKLETWRRRLDRVLFIFIAIGVVLPTMHQSSLGSLLILFGQKVHPLWQAVEFLPLLALVSAVTMGFAIVIFEASLVSLKLTREPETHLFAGLGRIARWLLVAFLAFRFIDLTRRDAWGYAFDGSFEAFMFWAETALFILPVILLFRESRPVHSPGMGRGPILFLSGVCVLLAGALYRINGVLVGFNPGPGFHYFPSVEELLVTLGVIAMEVVGYLLVIKLFPVLPKPHPEIDHGKSAATSQAPAAQA